MSITVDFNNDTGSLKMTLDAGPQNDGNVQASLTKHETQNTVSPEGYLDNIKNSIASQLKSHVDTIRNSLNSAFQSNHKFVYPGTGTFKFSKFCIGEYGEALAEIEYLP